MIAQQPSPDREGGRVVRWFTLALVTELAILAVTGVFLIYFYRPSAAQLWRNLGDVEASVRWGQIIRVTHRLVGYLAVGTAVTLAALQWTRRAGSAIRTWVTWGCVILLVAASFTGFLLPWDQLALEAVTVGTNKRGFGPLFDDQVRFVLIDGAEISPSTLLRWFWIHLGLGAMLIVVVCAQLRRRWRHDRDRGHGPPGTTPAVVEP